MCEQSETGGSTRVHLFRCKSRKHRRMEKTKGKVQK